VFPGGVGSASRIHDGRLRASGGEWDARQAQCEEKSGS
jgi:hypothetical protein